MHLIRLSERIMHLQILIKEGPTHMDSHIQHTLTTLSDTLNHFW